MRKILFLAVSTISINLPAFQKQAALDFRQVYGGTNAGQYQMTIKLEPQVARSASSLHFDLQRDDQDLICVTKAVFSIGTMTTTITENQTGWSKTITTPLNAVISRQSESDVCETDISKFIGHQGGYVSLELKQPIELPVTAPANYDSVAVYLSPFNGYLRLLTYISIQNDQLVLDPSQLLTDSVIYPANSQNNAVTYYVYAQRKSSHLSLANGVIAF